MSKRGPRFMLPREHMMDLEVWAVAASDARGTQLAEGLAHAQLALDLFLGHAEGRWHWLKRPEPQDAAVFSQTWRGREGALGTICSALVGHSAAEQQTKAISRTRMEQQPLLTPPKPSRLWLSASQERSCEKHRSNSSGRQLSCFCSMRPNYGTVFEARAKTGDQGVDEALRRLALHFKIDFNISLMASDLGWVDAAAVDGLQDVVKKNVTGWTLDESRTNMILVGELEFGWDDILQSDAHLIGTPGGVIQVRTVRRLTREQHGDDVSKRAFDNFTGSPRNHSGSKPSVEEQTAHGVKWTLTPGCKGCI